MPEILGATNPVPGYDNVGANRNPQVSQNDTQIANIPDPNRVTRPDNRTEQQDSGQLDSGSIRYDSNFQTFLQRLRQAPTALESLTTLLRSMTVVSSGMSEGIAGEMAKVLQMIPMDEQQLKQFISSQAKSGSKFRGALFALLRNAYGNAASESVREDILQFAKAYGDYASSAHLEKNLLRNLLGMAESMPKSWGEHLRQLAGEMANTVASGDRAATLALLQQRVFPYMADYVDRTHDMGTPRALLSLLTLDMARYENGSEQNVLQAFHRMTGYGTLRDQLGGIDDQALLHLLKGMGADENSPAAKFANQLAEAASRALRGEGDAQVQETFRHLVDAMLINESVYMPLNHFVLPAEIDGRALFSEIWVDPDAENDADAKANRKGGGVRFLLKLDVQALGLFDVILFNQGKDVDVQIFCPEKASSFTRQIETAVSGILTRNGLTPKKVVARRMERPVTLTEVFPKIFEGKNCVDVKV
ncbi:MAG: hypothetical protein ACOYJZ_07470 [Acutalibacter sp.]|jgi:hypothetical protein